MATSITYVNQRKYKINKLFLLSLLILPLSINVLAQPVWNSGPTITPNPISFDLDFNIDRASTVYYFVIPGDYAPVSPTSVRSYANQPLPFGSVVANGQINYTSGDYSTVIYGELSNLSTSTQYTIQIVAEDQAVPGSLTSVSKITFYTLPCPEVYFDNGLQQFGNCVNLGASKRFNMYPDPDPNVSGILKDTEWVINWGDGTIYNYVSAFDGDYPDLAARSHTYITADDCNYVFTCAVRNPCGKTFSPQYVAIVHGRDWYEDGDGVLDIVNNADGSDLIEVCAGTETTITVRDNSTWDCQNPVVPGGLVAVPNDDPRNIEWLYGQDPGGAATNTITGTVAVAGLGNAPQASGRIIPSPYGSTSLAQAVTIPASCKAGEYFRIYLKNWNKCNWTDPEYVSTYIDILVIAAPDAPTVPNKTICFGGDRELEVTSTPVGIIRWYSDAALTNMVAENTTTFTPSYTGPGSISYWVTDQSTTGVECMSPATMVTLTINPIPSTPTISRSGPDFCYDGSSSVTLTANPNSPPAITGYQWYKNGSAVGGETSSTIILSTVAQSGTYTVRTFGIADTYCPSELSNAITVNIWALATVTTQPTDRSVCENGSTSFTMTAGGAARSYRWQRRIGAGAWTNIVGATNPNDGCNYSNYTTATLGISSVDYLQDGYEYRMMLTTTAGGCITYSDPATLTVLPVASISTQPANTSVCELETASFSVTASALGSSSITAYLWQRYNGSTWTYITGPTTPNDGVTYSGYNTATLIISNVPAGLNNYRYRVRITTTGGCNITSNYGTLTVNQLADITGQPPNRAICAGTNTTFTVTDDGNPAVTGRQWQRWNGSAWTNIVGATNPNDGCTYGGYTSATLTLTNVPTGMDTYQYRCVLTTNGPCTRTSNAGTLTVYPLATTTNPANASVCHGSATSFTITPGGAPRNIKWQRSTNGGSTWVDITGATSPNDGCTYSTYTTATLGIANAQNAMDTYQYRAVLTTTTGSCETTSGPAILTVHPLPVPTITGPNSVCIGSVGNIYTTEAGMTNYVWSVSAGGTITAGGGAANNTVTVTWNNAGSQSVSVNYTNANNCTAVTPTVYSVVVGEPPSAATLTGSLDDCFGDANSWIRSVITSGAPPYSIKYTLNGTPQADITNYTSGSNYDLGMLAPGTYTYLITEVKDLCGSTVPTAALPGPYTIKIDPIPDISATSPNTQTICSDGSASIILNSTVNNTIFTYSVLSSPAGGYTWTPSKDPVGGSITDNDGNGTETLTRQLQHDYNLPVTVTYTITPTGPGATACPGTSITRTVVVNPTPAIDDLTASICSGGSFSLTPANGTDGVVPGGTNYAWGIPSVTGGITGGAAGGGASITGTLVNLSGSDQTATYTLTPTSNTCTGEDFTVTVTVKSQPVGWDAAASACSDIAVGFNLQTSVIDVAPGNSQPSTFSWVAADNGNVTGESTTPQTGNTISDVIHNVTGVDQTVVYTVTPTGTNLCAGDSFEVTVTVGSEPVGAAGTTNACSDNALAYDLQDNIDNLGNGQASNFSWVAADNPNVDGESLTAQSGGLINDAITNVSGIDQNVVYTVTPNGTNGCSGDSFLVTATIRSEPEGAHDDLLICSGTTLNYNLQTANIDILGNSQPSTFSWVAAANFNVGGESTTAQTTGSITDQLVNITGGEEIVTYAVTPTGTNGCAGNTFTVSVTVKPEPVITAGQNVPVCSDNPMNYEILLNNFSDPVVDGITFTWGPPVLNPLSPLFTGGTARGTASSANITDTFYNTTGVLGTATYTITPYRDGCAGTPVDLVVTVGSKPILDPNLDKFACSGQPIELTLKEAVGSVVPSYYNITERTLSAGLTVPVSTDTVTLPRADAPADFLFNDKYTNTTGVNQTVTYHIQPILAPDCFGDFVDVVVTIRPQIVAGALTGDDEICYGDDAPVISNAVAGSGGDGVITYSWYYTENLAAVPGDTNWTLIPLANGSSYDPGILTATTKYVRKANDGSCPDEAYTNMITITVNPLPVTSPISGEALLCVGATNKIYQVTNTPGSTYTWTVPPSMTITSPQGLYFIITDATGTTAPGDKITVTETFTSTTGCVGVPVELPITIVDKVPGVVVSGQLNVCQGDSGVIYSVPWNAGSSYSWSIPAGSYITSEPDSNRIAVTFNMAISGQVSVVETSQSVCTTVHVPVSVVVHALPNVYNVSASQFYCFGTGGVTVTLSGSQSGVDYQLLKDGIPEGGVVAGTGAPLTWNNMTAGVYTVRATNAAPPNCTRMMNGTITVQENPEILITSIDVTEPDCFGGSDGLLVINASGGFPPVSTLTYSINGGTTFAASNTFNVGAGTYNVVVKDIMNCTATAAPVTVGQPIELIINSVDVSLPIDCYGFSTGSVRVDATGGTLNYTYEWFAESSMSTPLAGQTNAEATGLPAGTYYVKVTDANGCFKTGSVVLPQPAQITATAAITSNYNGAHISCNGADNAEITVTASGGTGALSYVLDQDPANVTGAGSGVFTGVGPGTYTVRVTDVNLCEEITAPVTVVEPTVITATAAVTSDYNGSDVTCNGASDGRITVTASGGTGALTYAINEIPGNLTGLNTGIFTGVPAGNYNITVTDKNSCTAVAPVTVTEPVAVGISASVTSNYNGSDVSCYGSSDGEITAIGSGGTGALSYTIVQLPGNLTGAASGIFTGIPAGTYTVRVTDVNGCTIVSPDVIVTNPTVITISGLVTSDYNGSQVSCFGASDGDITATASGGTGTLTYVLDQDPANVTGASTGVFTGLIAGTYTVTATDENGCIKTTANITISNPPTINASAAVTSNFNGSHISCNGADDAVITVTSSGGTGELSYVLVEDPANITGAASGVFTGVGPGTYTIRVTDVNLCEKITAPVTVVEPTVITASAAVTSDYNGSDVTCNGASDGRITVTASGGTGALTYAINEIPGNLTGLNTGIFTGVPAGSYNITVTDKNGCTAVAPVTVTEPVAVGITASVTSNYNGSDVSCYGSSDGEITAIGSGGTGALSYTIVQLPGNLTGAASGIFTGVPAGTYTVRVTDVNGCTIVSPDVVVTNPTVITITGSVTSNYNGSQISCNGASDGEITATASGGTGTLTYVLDQDPANVTGASTGVFTGLIAGTYTVTATDENGCIKTTANITISNPPTINASAAVTSNFNGSHISCNGADDAVITVTASGGTGALSYVLVEDAANVTGAASGVFTGVGPGTYTVRVTDVNSCEEITAPVTVVEPTVITATADVTSDYNGSDVTCNGASDGRITVTASGGTGALTYAINEIPGNLTGLNTGIFTGVPAGNYNITVTDKNSCTAVAPVTVTEPVAVGISASVTSDYNGSDVSCFGSSDGEITAIGSGGTGALSYTIVQLPGNLTGAASGIFTGIPAGTYTVRVTDVNGCTIVSPDVVVTNPTVITITGSVTSSYNGSQVSCNGASDGEITATASGGTGTLTYVLDQDPANVTGASTGVFTGLIAGTYTVTATDENGCIKTTTNITISNPADITATALITSSYNGSHVSCNGASDGIITVTASGGTVSLSYLLVEMPGNVTGASNGIFTGVPAGTYTVLVTDVNGCTETTLPVTLINPPVITATADVTSDYNGSQLSCFGASDGRLTVTASGGTGTLSYVLNEIPANVSGLITGIFTNLPAGTYTVTVTDKNGCSEVTAPVTITPPAALSVNASVTSNYNGSDLSCYGSSDGVITAIGNGGTGTLSYAIVQMPGNLTGTSSGIFTGVPAGTFTIRVTDVNGCFVVSSDVVVANPDPIIASGLVSSNYNGSQVSCSGASDGEITITASGGTGTLTYVLDQDPANVTGASTGIFTGLLAGSYTVTVTDENGCSQKTLPITISNPSVITAVASVTSNHNGSHISCFGASDGEITVTAAGGTGTLSYVLDQIPGNITGASSGIFTGIPAGSYTITVTDINLCTITTLPVTVTQPAAVTASAEVTSNYYGSQLSCFGASDGRISVTASGGTGALAYVLVEIPTNTTGAITGIFTGLPAGTYTINVTDLNSCSVTTAPVTITPPPALTLSVNVTSDYNGRNISCYGAYDGRAQAVAGGGTGIYFYSWYSDAAMTIPIGQLTPDAINLAAGTYYVRVMDINGCSIDGSVVLTQPLALDATITSQTDVLCYGNSTGSVTVEAVAGTGTDPYEYSINGGATWQAAGTFSSLAASTYTVLVRDINACIKQVLVTITQPTQLTASITSVTNVSCNGGNNGIVEVTATAGSGTAPYTYSIDAGANWQADGTFPGLTAGSYSVIVRDNNNCIVTVPVMITEPSLLQLTASPDILLDCYGDTDASGTFNAAGGTLPYTFTVQTNTAGATFPAPGFNSYTFFNAGTGEITVRVTDNNGCYQEATINITQPPQLLPGSIQSDQVLCSGDNPATLTQVTPATGGPGAISYQWQYATDSLGTYFNIAGASGPLANDYTSPAKATSTLYYRRMASSGICQPVYSDTLEVRVNPRPVAILSGGATICPGDSAVLKVSMPVGVPPYDLVINNYGAISDYRSDDTIWVKPVATTTYTLQSVADSNSCAITGPPNMMGSATVTVRDLAAITMDPSDAITCEYGMVTFEVGASGSDLLYQWYVDEGGGFTAISDGGIYFGANTSKLYLFGTTRDMDGYLYHAEVMTCSVPVTSADALLTVNTNPEIIHQPKDTTICSGDGAEFRITATGTGLTFQWQRNSGGGFVDVIDDANFSGAEDSVLVITDAPGTFNNNIFRVIIDGVCGVPLYSNFVVLRVNVPPTVTLNPVDKPICDGGGPVYFIANGSGMIDSLRWQVNIGGAGTWEDIYDNSIYSGTTTQQLSMVNIPLSYNTNQYRLALKAFCETVYSNPATLTVNSNPVVNFASDTLYACGGVDTPIDPAPSGGSGSWAQHVWTGDIGPLSNYFIEVPNFRSLIPVSYNLNYRVRDTNGCYGEGSVVVTVDSPDATFDQDLMMMCTPDTVTFTKDMTGIASFSWDFGDGSPLNTTDANPEHIFTNSNPTAIEYYNVTLTVVSDLGCSSSFTRMTTVYPAIDATFTANTNVVCSGNTVTFTALSGANNYYWDYGDGAGGPGSYITSHLFVNTDIVPLVRTVTLTTTSFYGCTDVYTLDITVMPVPVPQFSAAPTPQTFDPAGNIVNFTNETNPGTWNYTWKFGDGGTSNDEDPSHTYNDVGTYDVTLIVDNVSCLDSVVHQVVILPIPPVADFDSIPSGCAPLYIITNNTSLNTEIPGTTYRWDFGDGSYSTAKNPTYTYYTPGTYRIELTVIGPGGTSMHSQLVSAYISPQAYFEVTPSVVIVNDERVRCFNLTQFADSYVWEFGDGDTSHLKEPYHRYMEEGVYDITLWAYSNNGCSDMYILSPAVTVEPAGEIRFSTVFMPNKEGPIERTDLPTGGTEIDQFFFPPIREKVINYKLQIFNRLGVLIFESHDINIPWNGYYKNELCPQGVYVWYVEGKYANGEPYKKVGDVTLLH